MTKKNSKELLEAVETLIGCGAVFEGSLATDKTVRVDGKLVGNISKASGVIIGTEAVIEGNIEAEIVTVGGSVKGNITAPNGIEILPKAKVYGDVKTNILTVAEGAFFEGKSSMHMVENETNGAIEK